VRAAAALGPAITEEKLPMTQRQLDRAVAAATGESLATVHRFGFVAPCPLDPEDLTLAIDCPFCGASAAYPGLAGDGAVALAECDGCDVYFDFQPGDVYAAPAVAA